MTKTQFQKRKKCNMYALWRLTSLPVKRSSWVAMFALCLVVGVILEVGVRIEGVEFMNTECFFAAPQSSKFVFEVKTNEPTADSLI